MVSVFVQGENEQVTHRRPDTEIIPGYALFRQKGLQAG
jgi:hypothetical protein